MLACAVRLLDRGFFRIGSEDYAVTNETYGLATMRKEHVRLEPDGTMVFDYPAKHGKRRVQGVVDPLAREVVARAQAPPRRRRGAAGLSRGGGPGATCARPTSTSTIKETTGGDHSAKDFRTWNATVLAATALGVSGEVAATVSGRKRAITRAVKEVAHYLGNTPAVCRASYIDPRVFDAYNGGLIIGPALRQVADELEPGQLAIHHPLIEEAVLDLVDGRDAAVPGIEKV